MWLTLKNLNGPKDDVESLAVARTGACSSRISCPARPDVDRSPLCTDEQHSGSCFSMMETEEAPSFVTTKYPRMMDPAAPPAVEEEEVAVATVEAAEEDVTVPALLRPDGITREGVETRTSKFDAAFAPMTELSAEDVVVGCAVHGSELVSQSREHLNKFRDHIRNVDTSNGAQGLLQSLEAGQLVELPFATAKACVGGGLFGVAAGVRFGPKLYAICKTKVRDWGLVEKTQVVVEVVKNQTKVGLVKTAEGASAAWSWIKGKVTDFYGNQPVDDDTPL